MDIFMPSGITKRAAFLIFLVLGGTAYGFGISLTKAELECAFLPEYNRSFHYSWDMAASGLLELNGCFTFSGGITLGKIRGEQNTGAFTAADYGLPFFRSYFPLHVKFAYMYNAVFEVPSHTLLPTLSVQWRYCCFFLGPAMRYTIFDGNSLFEPVTAFLVYVNFYNTERAVAGISLGNTDDFEVRHQGAYSFYLYNRFSVAKRISIASEMELALSGNVGRITSVYGLTFKQGVIFTW
jgi:hypothetical protein